MRGFRLQSLFQSCSSLSGKLLKPAHISGLGLGLCLALALATPPSASQRANAARAAATPTAGAVEINSPAARAIAALGGPSALDLRRVVQSLDNSHRLVGTFADMGYRLDWLRDGTGTVPRLYLASLPNDLPDLESSEIRKAAFIKAMLPLILRVNEEILERRARLGVIAAKQAVSGGLSEDEQVWLRDTAALYGLKSAEAKDLLARVDVVPPSLTLAQAALESGWGTSRFAQKGNALFGQKIFVQSPSAMPSYDRDGNEVFRMRGFDDLLGSVRSYVHNLNSHAAYADFRKARFEMRRAAKSDRNGVSALDSARLARTLIAYSERGQDYTADVGQLIQFNGLQVFDKARLAKERGTAAMRPASEPRA